MLCSLLVFPGSDLLRDSSTADEVSRDLQLFCMLKSSLSSKPGSIIDETSKDSDALRSMHMKWDHYIQLYSSLTSVFGYQKSSQNTLWGLFCKMGTQNQTCLDVSCPWATSSLPHRWHVFVVPLEKLRGHWQRSLGDCCFEEALTPPAVQTEWGMPEESLGKEESLSWLFHLQSLAASPPSVFPRPLVVFLLSHKNSSIAFP